VVEGEHQMHPLVVIARYEQQHREAEPPDPRRLNPQLPDELAELMLQCLRKEPKGRPRSFTQVGDRLRRIYEQITGRAYPREQVRSAELRADALNNQGVSLYELGFEDEALRKFEEALKAEPTHPEALLNRGLILLRRGKISDTEPIRQLESAAEPERRHRYHYCIGLACMEVGRTKTAIDAFKKADEEKPNDPEIMSALNKVEEQKKSICIGVFTGHEGPVTSVVFSPDGRLALSGSEDKTVRLWDIETGKCIKVFEGHGEEVWSVAYSPDGRFALSGSEDKTVRLWDVETGKCIRVFEGHKSPVGSVAFSPDGRFALSGSWDETLRLWDIKTGKCIRIFEEHKGVILSVAYSPNGQFALSGGGQELCLWDIRSGKCIRVFEGQEDIVMSVAFSPDGRFALSGSEKGRALRIGGEKFDSLRLWDIEMGKCIRVFEGYYYDYDVDVWSVTFSPDGRFALSGSFDGTVCLWDIRTGKCIRVFEGHKGSVNSVAFSPDGRFALSGSRDETLRLWDVRREPVRLLLCKPVAPEELLRRTREHRSLLQQAGEALKNGKYREAYILAHRAKKVPGYEKDSVTLDLLHQAGRKGIRRRLVSAWRAKEFLQRGGVNSVAFSPDGRFVLSGSWDKTVRLWDIETGKCIRVFVDHKDFVYSVAFSPDGRFALSGSFDKTVRLWDIETGKCIRVFEGHEKAQYHWILSVALSPDGRFALSGSLDKTVRLWDIKTGKCIRVFEGHKDNVKSVTFSPDGRYAVSAGWDGVIILWEFDWEYEFPDADWDDNAKVLILNFLELRCPIGKDGFSRVGKPLFTDADLDELMEYLTQRGYGWLNHDRVKSAVFRLLEVWE